jgi:DNA-binding transcriptional LysR family regulator
MHLTLRQLSVFECVARHLSFTKAAEELHLSQPAVSMQVRQLEEAAELPLLEKVGKTLHLTEAGREVFSYARSISQQLNELDDVISDLKGLKGGHLRISVASTANSFATRLLSAFTKSLPGTSFTLDVTNRKSLLDQLANNETDLVIMGKPPEEIELHVTPFLDNPLVVIAPLDHPWVGRQKPISLKEIANETFVVREEGSGTRIAMERFFGEQGMKLKTGMEMTSNSAIKSSVEAGLGLGIVSIHTLELELESKHLAVLNVEGLPILRHWHVVHCSNKRLPPIAQAFVDFVESDQAKPLLMVPKF